MINIILILLLSSFNFQAKIKLLKPKASQKVMNLIKNTLSTKSKNYNLHDKDWPLVLAMIKYETDFRANFKGLAGEIGLLQVIPADKHIREIVQNIRCHKDEKYCGKDGYPQIRYKNKLSITRTKRFLSRHPKYALEAGLGEIQYWKNAYKNRLYKKWKTKKTKYWKFVKSKCKGIMFVHHYNWGPRVLSSRPAKYYGLNVLKYYNKQFGRKKYERFK